MHLEPTRISSWQDLVGAFLRQYKYNMDMAPDRMQLQNMSKKGSETFKEYAQRWRELAAQVEPPLYKKEMIIMFIETLQPPFYEHVLGSVSSNFSDIVTIGERIEHGLKSGKIAQGSSAPISAKKFGFSPGKKKEGEVQATSTAPYWGGFQQQYRPNHGPSSAFVANAAPSYSQNAHRPSAAYRPSFTPNNAFQPRVGGQNFNQAQNQGSGQKSNSAERVVNFTPISMTYAELLPDLLKNALVALCPAKVVQPPFPRYYDANAKCEYHSGEIGHSTENCRALRYKVQSLIDSGWLTFQEQKPSVEKNPLSVHANSTVNAVSVSQGPSLVKSVAEIKKPMDEVFRAICRVGLFQYKYKSEDKCGFHASIEHSIDECAEFKTFVQDLIDRHILQVSHQKKEEGVFAGEEWIPQRPKPLVI